MGSEPIDRGSIPLGGTGDKIATMAEKIRNVLVDVDGTLLNTQKVFTEIHGQARASLAADLGIPLNSVQEEFWSAWNSAKERYSVDPEQLIGQTGIALAGLFGGKDVIWEKFRDQLWSTYDAPIAWYPDAEPVLQKLIDSELLIGVSTHARPDWHGRKLEWTGMTRYLHKGLSHVVGVTGQKNYRSWLDAAKLYSFEPDQTVVVGDNRNDDANAAVTAGFKMAFYLNRNEPDKWSVLQHGNTLKGVIEIKDLWDMYNWIVRFNGEVA